MQRVIRFGIRRKDSMRRLTLVLRDVAAQEYIIRRQDGLLGRKRFDSSHLFPETIRMGAVRIRKEKRTLFLKRFNLADAQSRTLRDDFR